MKKLLIKSLLCFGVACSALAQIEIKPATAEPQSITYPPVEFSHAETIKLVRALDSQLKLTECSLTNLQSMRIEALVTLTDSGFKTVIFVSQKNKTAVPITIIQPTVTNTVYVEVPVPVYVTNAVPTEPAPSEP